MGLFLQKKYLQNTSPVTFNSGEPISQATWRILWPLKNYFMAALEAEAGGSLSSRPANATHPETRLNEICFMLMRLF